MQPDNSYLEDCPPSRAVKAAGEVFRCSKRSSPTATDMMTHEESGRSPDANPCLRRALSVFTLRQDAEHQARLFPRWKRKFIVQATLNESHGHTLLTSGRQPTHTSWWPSRGLDPEARATMFSVVTEVGP